MGRRLRHLLFSLLLLAAAATPAAGLDLQCSATNSGRVVLNELFSGGGGQGNLEFIEIYFLQPTDISNWKIYYEGSDDTDFILGRGNREATAYLPDGSRFSDNNCTSPLCATATTFPAGTFIVYHVDNISAQRGEVLLVDTRQELRHNDPVVVDYLKYYNRRDTDQWDVPASCGLILANHDPDDKDMARVPNGTGGWIDTGSTPTQGTTNSASASNVDHYEIWHDGQGLTCEDETVTVKACRNSDCSQLYTGAVTVTMLPDSGWVDGRTRTFSNGNLDMRFRRRTTGTVTFGIASANPNVSFLCRENGVAGDCTMVFDDSGLVFSIPTQIANKTSGAITMAAVSRGNGRRCRDAFTSVTRNITFLLTYVNPNTGTQPVLVNTTTVPAGVPTSVPLSFNANGDATFTVKYSDAGQIRLDASYSDGDLTLDGSDTFVVRPAGLCVESPDPNSDCATMDGSCSRFKKAGELFNLRVKGVQWVADSETNSLFCDNAVTPNFRLDNIPLSLNLVAPAGGSSGSLGQTTISIAAADHGTATIANQSLSEVGVFTITATPPDYLVPGVTIPASTSAAIGRFYPDQFTTAVAVSGSFMNPCNGFTYTGQPFTYGVRPQIAVAAWNKQLGQVQNYRADFRKFTMANLSLAYPSRDTLQNRADNTAKMAVVAVPDSATAVINDTVVPLTVTLGNDSFTYTRTLPTETDQARIAPFTASLAITVNSLIDSDGVTTATGDLPRIVTPTGNTLRYGEGVIQNTFGPENEALTMPFLALSYNGTSWVTNTLDNCSLFAYTKVENGTIAVTATPVSPLTLVGGTANLTLTPTNDPAPAGGTVTIQGNVPTWLEPDPTGEATFGIWRGNNRIINWKEIQR
ncbi:MAG: DUF6701 domain-containing protein [Thermodesulfobacteriota bacterium]